MSLLDSEALYRSPDELAVTPVELKRVMVAGSCLSAVWSSFIPKLQPGCECDFMLINQTPRFPSQMPRDPAEYDFQIVQVPLRIIIPERTYFRLNYSDLGAYERLFEDAKASLANYLRGAMVWNTRHGILTFVYNFLVPQQNSMGRLLPRYDLRNFVYFVERLNQYLESELKLYENAFLFDFDQIVATFGRKYIQDDAVYHTGHAAALSRYDFPKDQGRLEPVKSITETYPLRTSAYLAAAWAELVASYRTINHVDRVKLVIVDIDDTIWRGVAAESQGGADHELVEGWPLGFIEALLCIKRRGILLAVVSKNDEGTVSRLWARIVGKFISLEDFAVRKINWRPKADNVEDILREVNLLPTSVVFIDDNPVEREAVRSAFPGIRVFGPNPYIWRRLLLWSAETQTAVITTESINRTKMVQAQVQRESQRKGMSHEEFLASLDLHVEMLWVDSSDEVVFARALELINKTNQFNTTGKRWTAPEFQSVLNGDTRAVAFRARDRFTDYGIVGVVLTEGVEINQFVMSCRVVGMDIELAVVAEILAIFSARGYAKCSATTHDTELNLLSRDLFARCGFVFDDGAWRRDLSHPSARANLKIGWAAECVA